MCAIDVINVVFNVMNRTCIFQMMRYGTSNIKKAPRDSGGRNVFITHTFKRFSIQMRTL